MTMQQQARDRIRACLVTFLDGDKSWLERDSSAVAEEIIERLMHEDNSWALAYLAGVRMAPELERMFMRRYLGEGAHVE